jgi:hypothetical protein
VFHAPEEHYPDFYRRKTRWNCNQQGKVACEPILDENSRDSKEKSSENDAWYKVERNQEQAWDSILLVDTAVGSKHTGSSS